VGQFKADPYDVSALDDEGTEVDFDRVLGRIEKLTLDGGGDPKASRWGSYYTSRIVIDNLRTGSPMIGTVFMARNLDLPLVGGASGIAPPALTADQGIGKHVAFLWDKANEVFWFQRDRNAVGMTAFKDYVMARTGVSVAITPRLHPDALARLNKLKYVKRIDVTFTRRKDGRAQTRTERGSTVHEFLELRERLDAAAIEVTIKPSRSTYLGQGSRAFLRETARLLHSGFEELTGAKILGVTEFNEDDEPDWQTVDLLRDKMHFAVELADSRFRDPNAIMAAIKRLWQENKDEA
jgi:hypothetical protein